MKDTAGAPFRSFCREPRGAREYTSFHGHGLCKIFVDKDWGLFSSHRSMLYEKRSWHAVSIFLSRACASCGCPTVALTCIEETKRPARHVAALWAHCVLIILFRSFRLALKPPVQVKKFRNEIEECVSDEMLQGGDHIVHAYHSSRAYAGGA